MKKTVLALSLAMFSAGFLSAQVIESKTNFKLIGNSKRALKENKKVVIGHFSVAQTVQNSQASTAGGGSAFAKMTVNFGGVDIDAYRAVVQEGYDLAVKKLTAAGYQVLNEADLKAAGVETYIPSGTPENFKINSNTATAINVQPSVVQMALNWKGFGSNPMMNKAKDAGAHMLTFLLGASAVDYDRGSRFGKKAKVSASPYLTFGGTLNVYPVGKGASPATYAVGSKEGIEDIAGPGGITETSKTTIEWLGTSRGKYVLDIDQAKYLAAIRSFLLQSVEQSVARFIADAE